MPDLNAAGIAAVGAPHASDVDAAADEPDLAVVGGGPVGAALALALARSGLSVTVLEARDAPPAVSDPRALALAYGSRLILERLGVWAALTRVSPIETVHVSQQRAPGRAILSAREAGVPALGYVVSYQELAQVMDAALRAAAPIRYLPGACADALRTQRERAVIEYRRGGVTQQLAARLVAVADGGKWLAQEGRAIRTRDYRQCAVVAQIAAERAPAGVAFERFTAQGPLALLPHAGGLALVWTASADTARELVQMPEREFLARLHGHFGDRVGAFTAAGARTSFPLHLRQVHSTVGEHRVLLGNAAHTLHPVAGQGFNLGLRDAWELAQLCARSAPAELGSAAMLRRYQRERSFDVGASVWFTDSLVRLFSNHNPLLAAARGLGLGALQCLPAARRFLARRMMFGTRV